MTVYGCQKVQTCEGFVSINMPQELLQHPAILRCYLEATNFLVFSTFLIVILPFACLISTWQFPLFTCFLLSYSYENFFAQKLNLMWAIQSLLDACAQCLHQYLLGMLRNFPAQCPLSFFLYLHIGIWSPSCTCTISLIPSAASISRFLTSSSLLLSCLSYHYVCYLPVPSPPISF